VPILAGGTQRRAVIGQSGAFVVYSGLENPGDFPAQADDLGS